MGVRAEGQAGIATAHGKASVPGCMDTHLEVFLPQHRAPFPHQHSPGNVPPMPATYTRPSALWPTWSEWEEPLKPDESKLSS